MKGATPGTYVGTAGAIGDDEGLKLEILVSSFSDVMPSLDFTRREAMVVRIDGRLNNSNEKKSKIAETTRARNVVEGIVAT